MRGIDPRPRWPLAGLMAGLACGLLPEGALALIPPIAAPPAARAPRSRVASSRAEVEAAIVQLVTIRADGRRLPRGSAFYVDGYGRLLTCAHVLDHMPREQAPRLRLGAGTELPFEVVKVDRALDLALLKSDPPETYLALGDRFRPDLGQAVLLAGFAAGAGPSGADVRLKPARVAALERRWAAGPRRTVASRRRLLTILVDAVADHGQSGGPLLSEATFTVIGVVRANIESATGGLGGTASRGHGAAVPLLYVLPFVDSALPE